MKRSDWADEWYQRAIHDLEAARVMRREGFYDTCAMLCQQAAEKAMKALWIDLRQCDPPRVHFVERLAKELGAPKKIAQAGAMLAADYFVSRYPAPAMAQPFTEYTADNADDRLAKAEEIIGWIESQWEDQNAG